MVRCLLTVALLLQLVSPVAATQFWLSPYGNVLGSTPPSFGKVPKLNNFLSQPSGSLYVWAKPDSGKTLKNWSLRLRSTVANVLDFSTATVYNPVLDDSGPKDEVRWEIVVDPNSSSNVSEDFMGFTVTDDQVVGKGIGPATTSDDDYYFGSNAWLLAKIDFKPKAVGTTNVFLEIGTLGLNNAGETSGQTSVLFGYVGDASFGDASVGNRHMSTGVEDATIQVFATPDADFDGDTFVTGDDFLIWQRNSGATGASNATGNATYPSGDTDVNGIDLAAWEFQYGTTVPLAPLSGSSAGAAAIPEPTTLGLSFLAGWFTLTQVSRRGAP